MSTNDSVSTVPEVELKRATFGEIFRYGFGGVGSNIPFLLAMQYLMFFFTDHAGVNAATVGSLFLISRIIDAVTDPLMGMLADRTETRWGRYRPWILFGAPVLGLLTTMLFWAPPLGPTAMIVYAYIVYIAYSIVSTVVNIPYHSLTPVLSQDANQRTTIATAKQVFGIAAAMLVSAAAIPLTTKMGGDSKSWTIFAAGASILLIIAFWLCASGAKRHDLPKNESAGEPANSVKGLSIFEQLKLITKNRAVLMLMIAFGTDMIAYAAAQAVNVYYFIYAVKRPDLIAKTMIAGIVMSVVVSLAIPLLNKKIGKKPIFISGSAILMVLSGILYFVPFTNVNVITVLAILIGGFAPLTAVVGWAMLADCVEYGEWKTGYRGAGTVSSQLTFINKAGMAFGGFIGGALLASSGYIANAEQTPEALRAIVSIKTLLPVAGYICSLISMAFYPITKKNFNLIVQDNAERRKAATSAAEN